MRLKFKVNKWLDEYHGNGLHFRDGDVADVADSEAQGLLLDFPENFTAAEAPKGTASMDAPPADKMFRRGGRGKVK
jgi:hypothetical protein